MINVQFGISLDVLDYFLQGTLTVWLSGLASSLIEAAHTHVIVFTDYKTIDSQEINCAEHKYGMTPPSIFELLTSLVGMVVIVIDSNWKPF